ncbi:AHH domain-containing protein, partial [Streptomyces griseus]|uniref:AHH domain-containing protein n=1 Tax=Streptomyces griseus TaxID=1911 RepID=UPI00056AAAB5
MEGTGTPATDAPPADTPPPPGTAAAPDADAGSPSVDTAVPPAPATSPPRPGTPEEAAETAPGGLQDVLRAAQESAADPESQVVEGPSPIDGSVVMVIGATQLVRLGEATRYARSRSLVHAVQLGDHLFGARSFAVLEGGLGTAGSYFLAVATTPTVTNETIGPEVAHWELEGRRVSSFSGFRVLPVIAATDGHRYGVNLLWTKERGWLWGDSDEGRRWIRMSRSAQEFWLSAEELKLLAFGELDRLVDSGLGGNDEDLEKAAAQLAEMNARAFALADTKSREKYLEVLVRAWTFEEHRHAIVQIMISLESMAQLQAVRERLILAGLYEQLFADLGSDLWDLLTVIGGKFGGDKPLTAQELIDLVAEALGLKTHEDAGFSRGVGQEETAVIGLQQAIEIEEAVRAVIGFVMGALESLKIMLTQPEKILSGLWALHELAVDCYLAQYGNREALTRLREVVKQLGQVAGTLVHGLRGAMIFGVGPRVLTRIKWAVIIEVLTWLSEIKAVIEGLARIEKIVGILRFLKMVKVFEGERIATSFTRVAQALHAGNAALKGLKDEHAVVDLMLMLPEEDGIRLGAALQEVEVPRGATLAALTEHPRLGPVLAELQPRAEALRLLGAKSGGLTPELAQTFARLTGKDGFEIAEVSRIVEALQDGEGTRFAKLLERIGFGRIGAGAQVKADLLALLAADSRRMEAVHQYGIAVVGQLHSRSAGQAAAFDARLAKLEKVRAKYLAEGKAVEFGDLVDELAQGKKAAWWRVDRPPGPPRALATALERAPVEQRIKDVRKRFGRRAGTNRRAMENALRQIDRVSRTDPAKAMEHLEKFEELAAAEHTTEGHVAEIMAEAETGATRETKALHHEPDEVPAQALTVRDELKPRTGTAGSPPAELKRSMEDIGQHQLPGNAPHHMAASSAVQAEVPRALLEEVGINPADSPLNGVYLPQTTLDPAVVPQGWTRHEVLHTDNYYKWVTQTLVEARKEGGPEAAFRALSEIKEQLLHGKHFPRDVGVPHESYVEWFATYRHNLDWLTDAEQLELLDRLRAARRRRPVPRVTRKVGAGGTAAESGPKHRPPEKAKARPEPETKPGSRPQGAPKPEPPSASAPAAEAKPRSGKKGTAEADSTAKSETKTKTEAKTKAKPKIKPKIKPKPKPKPKAKDERTSKAHREDKAEAKVPVEAEAELRAEPKPEPRPAPTPEPAPPPKA